MPTIIAHEIPLSIKAMFLLKGHCIFVIAWVKVGNMKITEDFKQIISSDKTVAHMYLVSVIPVSNRASAQCKGKDVSSHWAFPILQFPCRYVTWAQIEKFLFVILSCHQKVPGQKNEIISSFAISLDAHFWCKKWVRSHVWLWCALPWNLPLSYLCSDM